MQVDVILPAAGTSERMNLPVAKQFQKILGRHVLAYTVDCFHRLSWVRHIIVVVSADQTEFTRELMRSYCFIRVIVCAGSHTRHRSIFCGLQALKSECSGCDVVIIHDGARPFVSEQVVRHVAEAARTHGAAGVSRPLVSTVIRGDDEDMLVDSLDRRLYRNSEMPQAFHYVVITSAYEKCSEDDLDHGTECLLLTLKYSQCHAALVEGTDDLWKVTYQKDMYAMESVVKEKFMVVSIMNLCTLEFLALKEFQNRLCQKQIKISDNTDVPANTFVVVWDCRSSQGFGDAANKICSLYKQDMPSSAVRLDLMVVVVLLQHLHVSHVQTQTLSNENTNAGTCQSTPDSCRVLETGFDVGVSHVSSQPLDSSTELGCTSTLCHSSGTNNSSVDPSNINHSSHQRHGNDTSIFEPILHTTSCHRDRNSSDDCIHTPVPESQTYNSIDLTSQQQDLVCNLGECSPTLELSGNTSKQSDHERFCLTKFKNLIIAMKDKVQREICGRSVLVGVSCGVKSQISEQLTELIWQRSLYVDGQILVFGDSLS